MINNGISGFHFEKSLCLRVALILMLTLVATRINSSSSNDIDTNISLQ